MPESAVKITAGPQKDTEGGFDAPKDTLQPPGSEMEQQKITAWQQKRKAENAARAASKQPPLDENEWQKLFKLPVEPSRLEALLVGRQVEQYARQVDGFSATVSAKMFGVKGNLLPNEIE